MSSTTSPLSEFNGLIQHSFALRIPPELNPQYTRDDTSDTLALLNALFATPAETGEPNDFRPMPVGCMAGRPQATAKRTPGDYSPLVSREQTTIRPMPLPFIEQEGEGRRRTYDYPLPAPFDWTASNPVLDPDDPLRAWDGFVFARREGLLTGPQWNDFLIADDRSPPGQADARAVSWLLCQLLAHRRSRLFGPSLARGIFNLLLPHLFLDTVLSDGSGRAIGVGSAGSSQSKGWIVQPALSLFQAHGHRGFRPVFSLTLFMVPAAIADGSQVGSRGIDEDEIRDTVQAGWAVAGSRPLHGRPKFEVSGPLGDYLMAINPSALQSLGMSASSSGWNYRPLESPERSVASAKGREELTLREVCEATLFAVAMRMVHGPGDGVDAETRREVGNRVQTALSVSRVSSLVVVDPQFEEPENDGMADGSFPGSLGSLMQAIARLTRVRPRRRYRLDRPFFDQKNYAIGVLPGDRCVVVTTNEESQRSYQESALLEAGWIAYMVIGAATATGMIRSIYYDIEQANRSKPSDIADIEHEVVVDLHEIYDLDITWEAYRCRYRRLRKQLGITQDYEALNGKLQALYRETTTRFEDRTQVRLMWLTATIVILSALILAGTIVLVVDSPATSQQTTRVPRHAHVRRGVTR